MSMNLTDRLRRLSYTGVKGAYTGMNQIVQERKAAAKRVSGLEDMLSGRGSSIVLPSTVKYDDQITPNSIWTHPDMLKRIDVDEGDAVLLLEEILFGRKRFYLLRGPFKIETHERISPSYIFMNSSNSPYGGSYVEILNPVYASREFRGKVVGYYRLDEIYSSRGPGVVPMRYARKIADSHSFLRPNDGTIVPVMTYNSRGIINGIYQAEIDDTSGKKFQIPTDINLNKVYSIGVHLGFSSKIIEDKLL